MSRRDEGTERFDGCGSPPVVHGHVSVLPACCWCVRAASLEAHVLSALDTLKTHLLQHPRHMSPACSCAEASFPASAPPSAAPPPPPPAPACTALPVFMHVYMHQYIHMCMCVCVCVYFVYVIKMCVFQGGFFVFLIWLGWHSRQSESL